MQETLVWFLRKILWRRDKLPTPVFLGFPCGSAGKESACNEGDPGSIPGLGRSPGEGNGYPLQYSGLENSMESMGSQRVRHDWVTFTSLQRNKRLNGLLDNQFVKGLRLENTDELRMDLAMFLGPWVLSTLESGAEAQCHWRPLGLSPIHYTYCVMSFFGHAVQLTDFSSLTRDWTSVFCSESAES